MSISYFYVFLIGLIAVAYLVQARLLRRIDPDASHRMRALERFKIKLTVFAVLMSVLWLFLPHSAVLSTFGYPETDQFEVPSELPETMDEHAQEHFFEYTEMRNQRHMISLLQDYNRAIVRITEVVRWSMLLAMTSLLMTIYEFAKAIAEDPPNPSPESPPAA